MGCFMYLVFFSRLLREIAESPSLEILKPCLDSPGQAALDGPAQSEGLDQMFFRGAFKPQPHCESQLKTKCTMHSTDSLSWCSDGISCVSICCLHFIWSCHWLPKERAWLCPVCTLHSGIICIGRLPQSLLSSMLNSSNSPSLSS